MAPDSIQFNLEGLTSNQAKIFMDRVRRRGISLYVFGVHPDNARVFWNWKYIGEIPSLEKTKTMLEFACDMRLPVFFRKNHLDYIAEVILSTLTDIKV